jgi:hypothetical protein
LINQASRDGPIETHVLLLKLFFQRKGLSPTPYVISERAVKKAWIPPQGASCLPRKARTKVPEAYQYWHAQEPAKRRAIRDELVKRLKERARMMKSDADDSVRFKLLKQT